MANNTTKIGTFPKFSYCGAKVSSQAVLHGSAEGVHLYVNIVVIVINLLLSILGTFENILVVAAYATNNRLKTSANMLLVVLAVSDLLVTAIAQPVYVVTKIQETMGTANCFIVRFYAVATYSGSGVSLATIVILSVERFITLAYPYRYQTILNPTRLKLTVAASWLVILIMGNIALLVSPTVRYYAVVIGITVSILTVVSIWIWIHLLINRHKKTIGNLQNPSHGHKEDINRQKELETTRTSYLIIATILVCYAPVLAIKAYFFIKPRTFFTTYLLDPWPTALAHANSTINPLLLFWRKRLFRETAKKLLDIKVTKTTTPTTRETQDYNFSN